MDTCATCVYTLVKYRTVALFCLVFDDVSLLSLVVCSYLVQSADSSLVWFVTSYPYIYIFPMFSFCCLTF
jgi:hypothetical protein